jgi:hypothetical protein
MTSIILLICFHLTQGIPSQGAAINQADLKINGLSFLSGKKEILKTFGEPLKTFRPKYECGFISEDEQGAKYYTLDYGSFRFTGNESEGYLLENAVMSADTKISITYQGHSISGRTTLQELEQLFGAELTRSEVKVFFKDADDALVFSIAGEKLIRVMYWSPC